MQTRYSWLALEGYGRIKYSRSGHWLEGEEDSCHPQVSPAVAESSPWIVQRNRNKGSIFSLMKIAPLVMDSSKPLGQGFSHWLIFLSVLI